MFAYTYMYNKASQLIFILDFSRNNRLLTQTIYTLRTLRTVFYAINLKHHNKTYKKYLHYLKQIRESRLQKSAKIKNKGE